MVQQKIDYLKGALHTLFGKSSLEGEESTHAMMALNLAAKQPSTTPPESLLIDHILHFAFAREVNAIDNRAVRATLARHVGSDSRLQRIFFLKEEKISKEI